MLRNSLKRFRFKIFHKKYCVQCTVQLCIGFFATFFIATISQHFRVNVLEFFLKLFLAYLWSVTSTVFNSFLLALTKKLQHLKGCVTRFSLSIFSDSLPLGQVNKFKSRQDGGGGGTVLYTYIGRQH